MPIRFLSVRLWWNLQHAHARSSRLCTNWFISVQSNAQPRGPRISRRRYSEGKPTQPDPLEKVIESPFQDVSIPETSLADFVWSNVAKWKEKPAITCGMTGRSYSYAEARESSRNFAKSLLHVGFQKGSTLALILPNLPVYPLLILGAAEAGVVTALLNYSYPIENLQKQLVCANVFGIVVTSQREPEIRRIRDDVSSCEVLIVVGDSVEQGSYCCDKLCAEPLGAEDPSKQSISPEDTAFLSFASRSSRGVKLSHRNIVANICQLEHKQLHPCEPGLDKKDGQQELCFLTAPFYSTYGYTILLRLHCGIHCVCTPRVNDEILIECFTKYKFTILYMASSVARIIGENDEVSPDLLEAVHTVFQSSRHPVDIMDMAKMMTKLQSGINFQFAYGMAETSIALLTPRHSSKFHPLEAGVPIPNTKAKVTDVSTGATLGPEQVGELCVKGPQVTEGYLSSDRGDLHRILDPDGWLHTADLAYYNSDGEFFMINRDKIILKVHGYEVYPSELEEIISAHPDVIDASVVGIPDKCAGELPLAFVVPRRKDLTVQELEHFINNSLPSAIRFNGNIVFVEGIPKNHWGKVLRYNMPKIHRCVHS